MTDDHLPPIAQLVGDLHDAALVSIHDDWGANRVTIELEPIWLPNLRLLANGVTSLIVPHEDPWGPSVFVNNAALTNESRDVMVLNIQMQSGDTITVRAAQITAARA